MRTCRVEDVLCGIVIILLLDKMSATLLYFLYMGWSLSLSLSLSAHFIFLFHLKYQMVVRCSQALESAWNFHSFSRSFRCVSRSIETPCTTTTVLLPNYGTQVTKGELLLLKLDALRGRGDRIELKTSRCLICSTMCLICVRFCNFQFRFPIFFQKKVPNLGVHPAETGT